MKIVDAHVHLYEYEKTELRRWPKDKYILLAVSDDISSSYKTIHLSLLYEHIIPAVGIHPWEVHKHSKEDLEKIKKLVEKYEISVLGEIGLDKKFVPETFDKQLEFFKYFLELAKEYDLALNLHAPDAWRDVFDLLLKYDIKKAYFHWYTGPLDLLEEIQEKGYFIGINPAIRIQKKHQEVLKKADLKNILTESDGPYDYRGLKLSPSLIELTLEYISKVKSVPIDKLKKIIQKNLARFLYGSD